MNFRNWKSSYDKWKEIVKRTEEERKWDDILGWEDLIVVLGCGYCEEYLYTDCSDCPPDCSGCPLYQENYCDTFYNSETIFWQYVEQMRSKEIRWQKALLLAKKMLKRIEQDKSRGEENE